MDTKNRKVVLLVTVWALLLSPWVLAQETISGRIFSASTELGIPDIDLDVFDSEGTSLQVEGDRSGVDGLYTIVLPGPGVYSLRADAELSDGLVDQYYPGAFLPSDALLLVIELGTSAINIDFPMSPGHRISGTVTSEISGLELAAIDIDLFSSEGEFLGGYVAETDALGEFVIGDLPEGDFIVRADPMPEQFHARRYFGGASLFEDAQILPLRDQDIVGADISIPEAGNIEGRIVDADTGEGIPDVDLDLFNSAGERLSANARSDEAGFYLFGSLLADTYRVRVDPSIEQEFPRFFYPDGLVLEDGTPISVSAGFTTTGIDFDLTPGGTIFGRIVELGSNLPLAGIDLDLFDATGRRLSIGSVTDLDGLYTIGVLPPGEYIVRADPTLDQGYFRTYFPDAPGIDGAIPILVEPLVETMGVDFALLGGGGIRGIITDAQTGMPLPNIDLDIFDSSGIRLDANAVSDANGLYEFGTLLPGTYILRCDPNADTGFAMEYFSGRVARTLADELAVTSAKAVLTADFSLVAAGTISGRITSRVDGSRLSDVDIDIFEATTMARMDQDDLTDSNGNYRVEGMPPGRYILRAQPGSTNAGLRTTYFGGTTNESQALSFTVVANQNATSIDIALAADTITPPGTGGGTSGCAAASGPIRGARGGDIMVVVASLLWLGFRKSRRSFRSLDVHAENEIAQRFRKLCVGLLVWVGLFLPLLADAAKPSVLGKPLPDEIVSLYVPKSRPENPYAATLRDVYLYDAERARWTSVLRVPKALGAIRAIAGFDGSFRPLYVATANAILFTPNVGDDPLVSQPPGFQTTEGENVHLAVSPKNRNECFVATKKDLWITRDHGAAWSRLTLPPRIDNITALAFLDNESPQLILAAHSGIYISANRGDSWNANFSSTSRRRLLATGNTSAAIFPMSDTDVMRVYSSTEHTMGTSLKIPDGENIAGLALDPSGRNVLWTMDRDTIRGFDLRRGGEGAALYRASKNLRNIAAHPRNAQVLYWTEGQSVMRHNEALADVGIELPGLRVSENKPSEEFVLVAGGVSKPLRSMTISTNDTFETLLANQPPLAAAVEAALDSANYNPREIARWKRNVRRRHFLPTVSVGLGNREAPIDKFDVVRTEDRFGIKGFNDLRRNDQIRDLDYTEVRLSWDLGSLLFDRRETDISEEARRRAKDRNGLIKQITDLYYERIGLLLEENTGRESRSAGDTLELRVELERATQLLNLYCGDNLFAYRSVP